MRHVLMRCLHHLRLRARRQEGAIALATLAFMIAVGLGLIVMLWGIGYATGAYNELYLGTQQAAYAAASAQPPEIFSFDTSDQQPTLGCSPDAAYECLPASDPSNPNSSNVSALSAAQSTLSQIFNPDRGGAFSLIYLPGNTGTIRLADQNYQPDELIYGYQLGLTPSAQESRCSLLQGTAQADTPSTQVELDTDPDSETYGAVLCWQVAEGNIIYPAEASSGVVVRTIADLQVPPGCLPGVIFCPTYQISATAVATISQPQANNSYNGADNTGPSQTLDSSEENTFTACPDAPGPAQAPTAGQPFGFYNYSDHTLVLFAFAQSATSAQATINGQVVPASVDQGNGGTNLYRATLVMNPDLKQGDSVPLTFQSFNAVGSSSVTRATFTTPPDTGFSIAESGGGQTGLPPCPDGQPAPPAPSNAPVNIISAIPSYNGTSLSVMTTTQNAQKVAVTETNAGVTTKMTTVDSGTEANYQEWASTHDEALVAGQTISFAVTATSASGTTTSYNFVWQVVPDTAAPTPTVVTAPTLPVLTAGMKATVDKGTWDNATSYSYQWQSCDSNGQDCTDISGATTAGYTPTADEETANDLLQVAVVATNTSGSSTAVTNQQPVTANGVDTTTTSSS